MAKANKKLSAEEVESLKKEMDAAELDFANAKLAYYNRTEYKGLLVSYEDLKNFAKIFIDKNYAVQKGAFGKIHVRLVVANLMRE